MGTCTCKDFVYTTLHMWGFKPTAFLKWSLQQGGPRFVQVGSKNAAFFMGRCIKLSTRRANSAYVHELCIAAAELEQRYKNAEVN